jgi:hypothetical protein
MKKVIFTLTAVAISVFSFAQKKADQVAKFKTETIDMGKIKQDVPSTAVFEVTNISNEPLIIEQANPTCGCTIGDYTKEPIAPGKTGVIKATYNAKNLNVFEKHLTVKFAGTDDMKSITIKGEVLNADDYSKLNPGAAEAKPVVEQTKVEAAPAKPVAKSKAKAKVKTTPKKAVAPKK